VSWLQIECRSTPAQLTHVEEVLQGCGAVSITLVSDADEPVLEPAPGETPLWSSVRVQALFDLQANLARVRAALQAHGLSGTSLKVEFVSATDWQDAVKVHAVNRVFGDRLWVLPKSGSPADAQVAGIDANTAGASAPAAGWVRLYLEPGLAFGSGAHPTTGLCLEWLATHVVAAQRVLDFGCGSGILGIAAALLGARVTAVDHDPQALTATRENAMYNGIELGDFAVVSPQQWRDERSMDAYDVVVANILAAPLQALAAEFEHALERGGMLVLSGILREQADAVMASYPGVEFAVPQEDAGWVCLVGRRT